jgi:hypothetical protein
MDMVNLLNAAQMLKREAHAADAGITLRGKRLWPTHFGSDGVRHQGWTSSETLQPS